MPIEFSIVELMSSESSYEWLLDYFHPEGLSCPDCGAAMQEARAFRVTKSSQIPDYRCRGCDKTYNVYSGTIFEGRRLKPEQVVLLVRGVVKGEQAQILANEIGVCRQTVQIIRQPLQLTETTSKFDIFVNVCGGGPAGQAGAIRHGITRALMKFNLDLRRPLKQAGLVTRDPRIKERKKYGQKGARKRFQFSKR